MPAPDRKPDLDVIVRAVSRSRVSGAAVPDVDGASAEEARAFLQTRLANFGLLVAGIFALFFFWRFFSIVVETVEDGELSDWRSLPTQALEVVLYLSIWRLCRGKARSIRFLRVLDVGGTLLGAAAVMVMPLRIPYPVRPDYIVILALSYIMLVRAIYVPSTTRRTATIGIAIAPFLVISLFYVHYQGHDPADYTAHAHDMVRDTPGTWAARWAVIGAVWWTAATMLASVTSRVFYGLRKEVRDARRLGQYTLLEVIGQGGMGMVYRASHALLRRPTAVKLLPPENFGEESVARFEREVQLTAALTHPNTVRIFDYGRTPDRVFYYAMEMLEGASLDQVVKIGGAMPAGRVIHILGQIAGALAEAHGIGLIHRDIKPANIILTQQGGVPDVAKVVDFGLVKEVAGERSSDGGTLAAITRADSIAGTPQYMSPEAITTPEQLDARTDLYALGAVGYFLLCGEQVFRGRTVLELCSHHLHTTPIAPSRRVDWPAGRPGSPDLEELLMRCLAKTAADRPASARELRASLAACADAGTWTEADASAWWDQHGPAIRGAEPAGSHTALAATIEVDLAQRDLLTVPGARAR